MKLLISGGGTGGHVYPALTVAQALLDPDRTGGTLPTLSTADLLWIGSSGGIEEKPVRGEGIEFVGLAAGGLRDVGMWASVRNALRIAGSTVRALRILARFRPDVVFVTGGYACVAVALAARLRRIPVVIYLPDVEPGLAIRFLSRLAAKVAVTSELSIPFFRQGQVAVTGYPVRSRVLSLDRQQARQALGLDPLAPTLLVFGGSRGARSINRALVAGLGELLPLCQVVHISGTLDANSVADATRTLPEDLRHRYHLHAYLDDMPAALVAANLAVARAGAATLGEFPAAGLPSVLVPYPYSGRHQERNAEYLVRHGAARIVPDSDLAEQLVPVVRELLASPATLRDMRVAAQTMARPDADRAIAEQLWLAARRGKAALAGGLP